MEQLCETIRRQVLERMDFTKEFHDAELQELIAKEMSYQKDVEKLSIQQRIFVEQRVFNSLRKLDVLQELLEDVSITEIMVNGPNHIFYEKDGEIKEHPYHFASEEKLQDVIQQIVGKHNRVVNLTTPIVDTRLEDGSRVNIVLTPIAIDGSAISIRKFGSEPIDMQALIRLGTLEKEVAEFLKQIVVARYNIFISGGTSSGKTTFLNALSAFIPPNERVITIEDSAELQLQQTPNLVRLETRTKNQESMKEITARELIRTALRMRPDRIIVGECRGEETLDMLQAMNTGHDGSLSTGHGNSIVDMLGRLEMMILMGTEIPLQAIRKQISMGIDIMIHLERGRDQKRRVVEITEVVDVQGEVIQLNPLYRFQKGVLQQVGELLAKEKLDKSRRE